MMPQSTPQIRASQSFQGSWKNEVPHVATLRDKLSQYSHGSTEDLISSFDSIIILSFTTCSIVSSKAYEAMFILD